MAEDAQIVERDLLNDAMQQGGEGLMAAVQMALSAPIMQQSQASDTKPPSGGFFSAPRPFPAPAQPPPFLDFRPQFGPGGPPPDPPQPAGTLMPPGANEVAYVDTDAPLTLGRMDPAILARLQDRMAALDISVGARGIPDDATKSGFLELLRMANSRGEKWTFTLAAMERLRADNALKPVGEGGTRSLPGYVAPDYTSVGLEVRNRFRQALGRDPTEGELRLFSDELMAGASTQARREAEAAAAAGPTGPLPGSDVGTTDVVSADEVEGLGAHGPLNQPQQGDPMARFEELFAQKVSGEETLLRRSDEESASAGLARSNIERSAGGG